MLNLCLVNKVIVYKASHHPGSFWWREQLGWVDRLFGSVCRVNKWNNQAKLLWLEVKLVCKARKAWSWLTTEEKSTYNAAVAALRRCFKPKSKWDLYATEFQAYGKKLNESWGNLADNLQSLADKVFLDLDEAVKEKLSFDHFLGLLGKPNVSLAICQHRLKTLYKVYHCINSNRIL